MPVMNEPLSRVAQYVYRIVFGEGPIPEKPLSRIEWLLAYAIEKGISGINNGYYYNGKFYKDEEHTELLEPAEGSLYYDKTGKNLYLYDGTNYIKVNGGGGEVEPPVNFGYYYDGNFYTDAEHTQLIVPIAGGLYFDIEGRKLYVSDGAEYIDNDDAKLDKPVIPGQLDQVLTSNGNGTHVWKNVTCDASDITQKDGEYLILNCNPA